MRHALARGLGCLVVLVAAPLAPAAADPPSSDAPVAAVVDGATPSPRVLFTFDDGPDLATTRAMLDRLDARRVRGVFFLVTSKMDGAGPAVQARADLAREIARRGHVVASHGYRHERLDRLGRAELEAMLARDEAVWRRVLGSVPPLFRPPHGVTSRTLLEALAAHGRRVVLWNLNPRDYSERTAAAVVRNFERHLAYRERTHGDRGGIVLLHDTHAWSVEAFERIHDLVRARGLEIVGSPEALGTAAVSAP